MIITRKINGKVVTFETNSHGDIVSRDGKPIETKHKSLEDVKREHAEAQNNFMKNTGFHQRGSNRK